MHENTAPAMPAAMDLQHFVTVISNATIPEARRLLLACCCCSLVGRGVER
jgi:hypothetical protein